MRSSFSCSLDFDWWYKYTVVLNLGLVSFGGKPGHSGVGKVLGSIPLGGVTSFGMLRWATEYESPSYKTLK